MWYPPPQLPPLSFVFFPTHDSFIFMWCDMMWRDVIWVYFHLYDVTPTLSNVRVLSLTRWLIWILFARDLDFKFASYLTHFWLTTHFRTIRLYFHLWSFDTRMIHSRDFVSTCDSSPCNILHTVCLFSRVIFAHVDHVICFIWLVWVFFHTETIITLLTCVCVRFRAWYEMKCTRMLLKHYIHVWKNLAGIFP